MNITPNTNIRLLKCPIKLDNKNQITFPNLTAQTNYFLSLPYTEVEGSYYQRKDSSIYYPAIYDDLTEFTYVMYQNENYSNKWFYAFITGMEYLNDNTTRISILTDPFQTWQFDIQYKVSFVEREMINISDDVPGANLVPENLETGEFKVAGTANVTGLNPVFVCAYSDKTIDILGQKTLPYYFYNVNGIWTSVAFLVATTNAAYATLYSALMQGNQSEKIVALFTVPSLAVDANNLVAIDEGLNNIYVLSGDASPVIKTLVSTPSTIDGYTPINNKLRTYPYLYLGFNPPNGTSKIYRYEDFSNGTPSFKFISEVNPNPTVYMIPQNYRGQSGDSLCDSANLNGYPQIASKVDVYNSWLAENTGIINVQQNQAYTNTMYDVAGGGIGLVSSIASSAANKDFSGLGDVASGALSLYKTAANYDYYIKMLSAQQEKQAMLPDNVSLGGSNATLLGYGLMDNNIFTRYNIKQQFARKIDGFFNCFGYQTNAMKLPNINNRPFWNYVKTQGMNISGNIPNEDLEIIKTLFNSGITLWHNPSYFMDYTQNNKATT